MRLVFTAALILGATAVGHVKDEVFYADIGEPATLPCNIRPDPDTIEPTIIWQRGTEKVTINERVLARHEQYIVHPNSGSFDLHIRKVHPVDSGRYVCYASTAPDVKHLITLTVQVSPTVVMHPVLSPYYVDWGANVPLSCFASGNPPPVITWTKAGGTERLPNNQWSSAGDTFVLYSVGHTADGRYQCTARNGVGNPAVAEVEIVVTRKPKIVMYQKFINPVEGKPLNIKCVYRAKPEATAKWYFEKVPINPRKFPKKYAMEETLSADGSWSTQLTVRSVSAKDYGEYSCVIENQAGKSKRFTYVSHDFDETWLSVLVPTGKSIDRHYTQSYVLEGLQRNTTYKVRVQAQNAHGWGDLSKIATLVTTLEQPATTTAKPLNSKLIVVSRGHQLAMSGGLLTSVLTLLTILSPMMFN